MAGENILLFLWCVILFFLESCCFGFGLELELFEYLYSFLNRGMGGKEVGYCF